MATLILDKKTGTYKVRVKTATGTTKTLSTKATTKPEAQRILKQSRLAEIEEAAKANNLTAAGLTAILAGKRLTFDEAINGFSEYQKLAGKSPKWAHEAENILRQFANSKDLHGVKDLLTKPINTITEEMVYAFINAPGQRNANWRRGQRGALNKFFEFCQARGWMLTNPARLVAVNMKNLTHEQKETKQRNPFTEAEVDKLLKYLWRNLEETVKEMEALPPDKKKSKSYLADRSGDLLFWYSAVAIGRYTGLRLGDIAQLEWSCFSKRGKICVWTDKRDRRVELEKPAIIADAMAAVAPVDDRYIFPVQAELARDVTRRANLSTYFGRILERAGVHGKSFHDLRSSYIVDCDKRGIPIEHISRNVGHVSSVTTRGYMPKRD